MAVEKDLHTAKYLFVALMISVFAGETLIMFFIDLVPVMAVWQKALLDATFLLALSFPAIYVLAFKPLKDQIIVHQHTQNQLFAINAQLKEHEKTLEERNFELKRANLALKESNDRFAHLFDFAPVGYMVLSDKGIICEVNLTGMELLGTDKVGLLNKDIADFLPSAELDHWWAHFRQTRQSSSKQTCKLVMRRVDGNEFYALLECRRDDILISSNVHVSFTDITMQNWASFQ